MRSTRTWAATAGLSLLAVAGCGGQTDTTAVDEEAAPGFLSVADDASDSEGPVTVHVDYDSQEDGGLDPQMAAVARSWSLFGLVYEPLVTVDEEFGIQPKIASSWEQPDDTTYVFEIDGGATFSNGRPVEAADVVGSLERLLESGSVWSGQMGPVESVSEVDASHVEVKLSEPYTPFLAALANNPASVLPMKEIESGEVDIATEMLGTGPFAFVDHRQDEHWEFTRNPEFRDVDDVHISDLRVEIAAEDATRQAALREGSSAMASFSNVDALSLLEGTSSTVYSQTQSDFYYLQINGLREGSPLADEGVRFAINSAVDRQNLSDVALAGEAEPTGVTPSNLPGACDPAGLPSAAVGAEDAAGLVEESAYDGEPLDLLVYSSEPVLGQMAQVIQQQLETAGVTVNIEQLDYAAYTERTQGAQPADFDMALGWFAGYADPAMVAQWWNPEFAGFTAPFMPVRNDVNELIAEAAAQPESEERSAAFTSLCEAVDQHSEMVPLVHRPGIVGLNTSALTVDIPTNEGYGDVFRHLPTARPMGDGATGATPPTEG